MIPAFIYLAIGAFLHLIFIGSDFDFSSAATWILLLGWPLFVPILFLMVMVAIGIIAAISEAFGR